jgi:polyhydroxyalkanoate synthesis regulator phasin
MAGFFFCPSLLSSRLLRSVSSRSIPSARSPSRSIRRARVATEAATRIVDAFVAKAANGEMSQQAAQETAKDVLRAQRAAAETGGIAANVPTAAAALSREAERLRSEVEDFLAGVRAA